jgi:hypothetical protein
MNKGITSAVYAGPGLYAGYGIGQHCGAGYASTVCQWAPVDPVVLSVVMGALSAAAPHLALHAFRLVVDNVDWASIWPRRA